MTLPPGVIGVVGIGEDGAAGLRTDARAVVEAAEVLVGGERHLAFFPKHPAERVAFRKDTAALAEQVACWADAGQRVVVLASGDPVFFGVAPLLVRRLGRERVRIFPSVGSVQLAFARIGEAWQDATVLSAHGRPLRPVVQAALGSAKVAILTDDQHTPSVIAAALLEAGMERDARTWLTERLGGPREQVRTGTLAEVSGWSSDPLNVLVVLRDPTCVRGTAPRLGLPDDAYAHERGQITKAEVRAVSVARLSLRHGDTVWDVGAGSGSVSVEAAWFCEPGRVYAVERRPEQAGWIEQNVERFGATNVQVVAGEAPEALADLPDPDAVLVGGSGGRLAEILEVALSRLRPSGRLVLNLATLERLQQAMACLEQHGLAYDLAQVSVARAKPLAGLTRLAALNPVFVLSAVVGTR